MKHVLSIIIVLLVGVVVYGIATQPPSREERLADRFDQYVSLRIADDTVALYEMVAPEQRAKMDLPTYIQFYGQGVFKTHSIVQHAVDLDVDLGTATMDVTTDGELNVDRLPPNVSASLRVDDADALRQKRQHPLEWVWRSGDWYVLIESDVLEGQTADGKPITSPFQIGG